MHTNANTHPPTHTDRYTQTNVCTHTEGEIETRNTNAQGKNIASLLSANVRFSTGYGSAPGQANEISVYNNVKAAYDMVVNGIGFCPRRVVMFGRSIGTGPAIRWPHLISSLELLYPKPQTLNPQLEPAIRGARLRSIVPRTFTPFLCTCLCFLPSLTVSTIFHSRFCWLSPIKVDLK